ncbi:MAG: hypothetical protein DME22_11125 [Verrucomicrobia bacterium]|nr:MAG: hypothetical protein DME22_11125 [Verrucomicrobiota bacterium]
MKLKTNIKPKASVLLVTLGAISIIGLGLATYLTMVKFESQATFRSLAWNTAIPVTEAGVEEALTQLRYAGTTNMNLSANGWTNSGGLYSRQRTFPDSSQYFVSIKPGVAPAQPVITCAASVPMPASFPTFYGMLLGAVGTSGEGPSFATRTVQVTVTNTPLLGGPTSLGFINMNGNNVNVDSFDSMDPKYSSNGLYVASKANDNGDLATVSGLTNAFNVGNANIKGHIHTGPGGSVVLGPQGSVGDSLWVDGHNRGIETGHFSDDMNVQFGNAQVPFTSGSLGPSGPMTVNGTTYNNVVSGDASLGTGGRYQFSTLSGSLYVSPGANVVLYVPGNADLTGIVLGTNATIKIYNGTATGSGQSVNMGTGAGTSGGHSWNFQYYGLPSVTSITYSANATYTGTIYAPQADLKLNGGGNNTYDFVGCFVVGSLSMQGHFNVHYDEALKRFGPNRNYVITSWNEI